MKRLSPEICIKIRNARKEAKLSQETIAAEVGCKQPALSMFEQGDGTKLNDETVAKLAKKFGISLDAADNSDAGAEDSRPEIAFVVPASGFCPNPHCPTNHAYSVDGRDFRKPDRAAADPVGGKFCAMCGESLVRKCPNCGSPVHEGGFCSICGEPYIVCRS